MILYNVTINIDNDSHEEWLEWMLNVHIPEVMKTGMFLKNKVFLLHGDEDSGGLTYSIQYFAESMKEVDIYIRDFAPRLRADADEKFGGKFVAFRSLLEMIHSSGAND
jgi:hypothetical protein